MTTRRAITKDEQKLILQHMAPEMQDITVLAIETAMRRGEILGIQPQHINHQRHTLHIPVTKTNTPRTIPLSGKAYAILKDFTAWSIGIHSVTKYFRWACRDAGITGLCFHCTRHTGVSRLAEVLTPIQVAAISGHKSGRMLLHYSHPDIEALAKLLG